jgi:hypothetical protein
MHNAASSSLQRNAGYSTRRKQIVSMKPNKPTNKNIGFNGLKISEQ